MRLIIFIRELVSIFQLFASSIFAEAKLKKSFAGAKVAAEYLRGKIDLIHNQESLQRQLLDFGRNNSQSYKAINDKNYGYDFIFSDQSNKQFHIEIVCRFDVTGPNAAFWSKLIYKATIKSMLKT